MQDLAKDGSGGLTDTFRSGGEKKPLRGKGSTIVRLFGLGKPAVHEDEKSLIKAILRGDEDSLEIFYNNYFPKLYRYIYYRVGRDHQHTEEVVNDTFMEALDKIARYDSERGSVESWLITLSRNRIRSSNTTVGKARAYEQSWSMLDGELETLFADLDKGVLPESVLENRELADLVGATMGTIPEEYSRVLEMKYLSNLSVREIAETLRKTEKSVESQLTRARLAFREGFKTIAVDFTGVV